MSGLIVLSLNMSCLIIFENALKVACSAGSIPKPPALLVLLRRRRVCIPTDFDFPFEGIPSTGSP